MIAYKKGDFGYWWTVTEGNDDISNVVYNGDIDCSLQSLKSLYGAPKEINGDFYCQMNKLTTLEHAPNIVNGNFDCSKNNLGDLAFGPKKVSGNYLATNMQIKSLGCDLVSVGKDFDVSFNKLEEISCFPDEIGGSIIVSHNNLEKLNGLNIGKKLIANDNTNKYLEIEYKLLKKYPDATDVELTLELFKITNDESLIPDSLKSLFLF